MQLGHPDAGDFRGFEVDLLEKIGRRAGFRLHYRRALWSVIIRELMIGNLDLVCSAATVTEERAREVDFCVPHLRLTLAVVKRAGVIQDAGIKDLRVGVRRGTTAEAYARQHGVPDPTRISESNEELYASLAAGELDVIVDDSPIARYFSRSVAGLAFTGLLPDTKAAYAIMVRKGNDELRADINRTLEKMELDGTRQALLSRWFGDAGNEETA
jgi:ABC-type amino acid transport substrate-binding protein